MTDNVCITISARNREWVLPYTLESILNLDYPKNKIGIRFIINDNDPPSIDRSPDLLLKFKRLYKEHYRYITIWFFTTGGIHDTRNNNTRKKTVYIMKLLKNLFTDSLTNRDDLWLYMDSDICLKKDTLSLLVNANKDVIAGLCNNGGPNICNFLMFDGHMNKFDRDFCHEDILKMNVPVKVDFVAGITLMKRWVAKKIKFYCATSRMLSEDEGAMREMMSCGIERWLHPKAEVYHIMDNDRLNEYKKITGLNGLQLHQLSDIIDKTEPINAHDNPDATDDNII